MPMLLVISSFAKAQLDDPTRPPSIAEGAVSETEAVDASWDLSSILVSPERNIAIINGKTVTSGDVLSGAKVLSIQEAGVKLRHRGEIILLKLFPANIKTLRDTQK